MPWITLEEVAERYRITPSGVMNQRAENRMPGIMGKHVGKRVLWASEELDAYDRLFTDNPQPQVETFGSLDALVLEVRGVNKRLDRLIKLSTPYSTYTVTTKTEETEDE
jgi:hypothetical protein